MPNSERSHRSRHVHYRRHKPAGTADEAEGGMTRTVELSSRTGAQAGGIFGNEVVCASEVACSVEVGSRSSSTSMSMTAPLELGFHDRLTDSAGTVTGVHRRGAVTSSGG